MLTELEAVVIHAEHKVEPDEEVVYDVSMEMVNNHQISDALFQKSEYQRLISSR